MVITAYQWGGELNDYKPPRAWVLSGCSGRLPDDITTCATWMELTEVYEMQGYANAEFGPVRVSLQGLPRVVFKLNVTDRQVGPIEVHNDLTRIPDTARIVEVTVVR